jgi:hypothetical protein
MLALGTIGWIGAGLAVVGFVLWPVTSRVLGAVFRLAAVTGLALVGYGLLLS